MDDGPRGASNALGFRSFEEPLGIGAGEWRELVAAAADIDGDGSGTVGEGGAVAYAGV